MGHRKVLPATLAAGVMAVAIAVLAVSATASPQGASQQQKASAPASVSSAQATIQRTFVSTAGNDANPCTRTAPCRNFSAALVNTTAGGEVVALTSGGYGAITLDKSVTIVGAPGVHVAITAFAGNAIDVNAGATDTVVLRNLYLTGLGADNGILFEGGGVLHVENVVAGGFTGNGLEATSPNADLVVRGSTFRQNEGNGLHVGGELQVEISSSQADHNGGDGFTVESGSRGSIVGSTSAVNGGGGYQFDGGSLFVLANSVANTNSNDGVSVVGTDTTTMLKADKLSDNGSAGLTVGGETSTAQIGGSTISGNSTGLERTDGTLQSFGDNLVRGNLTETSGTIGSISFTRLRNSGSAGANVGAIDPRERGPESRPARGTAPDAPASPAATIQRTFVSTSGNDANPCTAAAPCRNFAAAMLNTTSGGEVVALDSGGYGPVVIDKAVTIAGTPGQHVAITATTGTAVEVSAAESDVVILRNMYITGIGGDTGIDFESGAALHVEGVVVAGFQSDGLDVFADGASLFVRNSTLRGNSYGIVVDAAVQMDIADTHTDENAGDGMFLSGDVRGQITRSAANRNGFDGFFFEFGAIMTLSDSVADGNATQGVVALDEGTEVMLSGNVLSNNGLAGLEATEGGIARISDSAVFGNDVGLVNDTDTGTLESFGDNLVAGNTQETDGTITTVGKT